MPRPPEPGTGPEREEERQRKLAALRARLREDARSLRTPDDWARCLRLAALMPGEDFANILLVSGQRPAAVMVADYRQWTAMGRQVRRGEKAPGRRAHRFAASWAPAYLEGRDISAAVAAEWDIGYAPAGWTTLTDHLRSLGHGDDEIEAAGLAKPSTRGTFIDRFRDRVMLPVHDERQARWVHRTREPRCRAGRAEVPQQPETAGFRKGSLLFGLHRARPALAQGAIPVTAEGPFDAIAVNLADPGRHAGLAPCGTALTSQQAGLLSQAADLPRTGILAAFDSDAAGRKAAARAYGILRPHTCKLQSALLNAKDPAQIMQQDGPAALRAILREHREPLSAVVIDTHIEGWKRHLRDIDGRLRAMRSTAALIAGLLPPETVAQVARLTKGRDLLMLDDMLRPVENPELVQIARIVPLNTACQVMRAASTLDFDASEVLAEVANAASRSVRLPKGRNRVLRDDPRAALPDRNHPAAGLARTSFPSPPLAETPRPQARRRERERSSAVGRGPRLAR